MQENYLAKWLNNELTEAELEDFKKTEGYATYQKIQEATKQLETPEFKSEEAWNTLENFRKEDGSKIRTLTPFKGFLRVAAVITIILGIAFFYVNNTSESITTQYAENTAITLPDASQITLNADSHLSYNKKKWAKNRVVSLKGEAFFKVAKGEKFTVKTEQGTITVLGTQFNVENREDFFEVSCFEGLVGVTYHGNEFKLPAGSSFISVNGKTRTANVTKNGKPSWLNNESSFKSIPLKFVLEEFKRQFNKEVSYTTLDVDKVFTGSFSNTDMDLALKSICAPLRISYKFEGNKVIFYGESAP